MLNELQSQINTVLSKQIFFIAGTEKSGTTWLQMLLNAHPQVACKGEGQFASVLAPGLGAAFNKYTAFIQNLNAKVFNEIDTFPVLTREHLLFLERSCIGLLLSEYGDDENIISVGEKTPGNIRYLDVLNMIMPDAKFLFIYRDGRDSAVSGWIHLQRQYGKKGEEPLENYTKRFASVWKNDFEKAAAFKKQFPEKCIDVRYEDLQNNADVELSRIFSFLGADSDEDIINTCIEACRFSKLSGGREEGEEDRSSHFRKGIIGDWKNHFTSGAIDVFNERAGDILQLLGYEEVDSNEASSNETEKIRSSAQHREIQTPQKYLLKRKGSRNSHTFDFVSVNKDSDQKKKILECEIAVRDNENDHIAWTSLAMALRNDKKYDRAIHALYRSLAIEPKDFPTRNLLVLTLKAAGRHEDACVQGHIALHVKDKRAMNTFFKSPLSDFHIEPGIKIPAETENKKNIIAFSLWGDDPVYTHGAIINCQLARDIYYGWRCRFYCDRSVPESILKGLQDFGAEVVLMDDSVLAEYKPLWRFFVADDPEVGRFICRDTDSRLNVQEAVAVDDWIKSDKPFHIMRDHVFHIDLILAGMWGGTAGLLPSVKNLVVGSEKYKRNRWSDQAFLADVVWPLIREHSICHDSNYRFAGSVDFPLLGRLPRNLHVGGAVKKMKPWKS